MRLTSMCLSTVYHGSACPELRIPAKTCQNLAGLLPGFQGWAFEYHADDKGAKVVTGDPEFKLLDGVLNIQWPPQQEP
jgi:hypothetical protein